MRVWRVAMTSSVWTAKLGPRAALSRGVRVQGCRRRTSPRRYGLRVQGRARTPPAAARLRHHPDRPGPAEPEVADRDQAFLAQNGPPQTSAEIKSTHHATRCDPRRKRNMRGIKSGRTRQMRLRLAAARTWGGARKGAGRKPRGRPSMPHVTRPKVDPRFPVQVTIRTTPGLPSLRSPRVFGALRRAIARA